ncbi:MAG: zinc ABC transporter substrate-binding protein [Nocardioides sp.]|nr:zinc ABC transporter substrate-binding protein [Nocardioides sp.]
MLHASRSVALAASTAALVLLAGCGTDSPAGEGRSAVASFYPLAWVTEQVAGDAWQVTNLTQPGQEPHHLSLDIAQTAALEDADLVVLQKGMQPAVDGAIGNLGVERVVDAAAVVTLKPATEGGHDHDEEDGAHAEEHAEGDLDPHFWLDPLLMADLGDAVATQMAEADPEHADEFTANAAALRADLEALEREYTTGLATCQRDVAVVSHDAFGYLARYGVRFEAIAGLTPDAEPTAADLAHLQSEIREYGVTTVFYERLTTSKMAEALADDVGVETAVLDPLEGLSDETADEDYLSLMRANLEALRKANNC